MTPTVPGAVQGTVTRLLRIGFEELGLHRIELGVYSFNEAAIRCYQNSGLTIEGTSRDSLRYDDEFWSLVEMSMLAPEWQARQAHAADGGTLLALAS